MTQTNKKVINKWINVLKLQEWQISCEFSDELQDFEDGKCFIDPVNLMAIVLIDKKAEFEEVIIHEFLHIMLADIQKNFELIVDQKNDFMAQKVLNDLESFVVKMERILKEMN